MIILVSGATATLRDLPADAPVGHLLTPRNGNDVRALLATGRPLAADNDCFQHLNPGAYRRMLHELAPHAARVRWVAVPDVVGDASATLRRWRQWRPLLARLGLRAAYVAQDGSERHAPPWDELDCLFIGGSTAWKESFHAARLCIEARARGAWVHVGRINTVRRLRHFDTLADSFDGAQFSRFPRTYLPRWCAIVAYRQESYLWPAP